MNNIALFVCGLAITLLSGMGVLVYCVTLGYKKPDKSKNQSGFNVAMDTSVLQKPAA